MSNATAVADGAAPKSEDGETYLTLKEAVAYTNRSTAFFNPERKAQLIERGAEFGGHGRGAWSRIPKSVIDELGWAVAEPQTRKRRTVSETPASTSTETAALAAEIARLEEEWADAKEKAGSLGGVIKAKRAELVKAERASSRVSEKAAKELAKAREALEKQQARIAELERLAG